MAWAGQAPGPPTGLQEAVVFSQYGDLSSSTELARRLVSPLNAWRLQRRAAATGASIREQPVDLSQERFALYVPAHMPAEGYGLLVFVPPWDEAKIPAAWMPVLDRLGVILVTAARSGNEADLIDRREPLALLAAHNVTGEYRVDPQRIYVGGFSGGARVALRLALGYPDLFHGALLDAGSDAIGVQIPPPPRELFERFQDDTRVVYLTGEEDRFHQGTDRQSRQALKSWCVTDIDVLDMPHTGHELADAAAFGRALASLDARVPRDAGQLADCRAHVDHALNAALDQVQAQFGGGKIDEARRQLDGIDTHFGGLAAPRSVELAARLEQP
ncbi:hypothetical protein DVT68_17490 [Dyella solisilvae]|uniref:Alpha/beta hydrolase n=2 Tax=Dyella solisilvae TaxID=1920168 RepID=A0A370K4E4_9GAMM|nr:hypothetical protein DVT68_17490 [Dyella solisilvae]